MQATPRKKHSNPEYTNIMTEIHDFLQQQGYSYLPDTFHFDGRIHRWSSDEKPEKDEWYIGFQGISSKGNSYQYLMASSWSSHKLNKVEYRSWDKNHQDYDEIESYVQKLHDKADEQIAYDIKESTERAQAIWNKAVPTTNHPYLTKKKIRSYDLRVYEGALVIPCGSPIVGLQFIQDDGTKRFLRGSQVKGHPYLIKGTTDIIGITESYANAATIHETLGIGVYVCFGCTNMIEASKIAHKKYPSSSFVIFADNDEAGIYSANKSSAAIKAAVLTPTTPGNDWNDEGPDALKDIWDPKGSALFDQFNKKFAIFIGQKDPQIIRFDESLKEGYKIISYSSFKAEMDLIKHPFLEKPAEAWLKSLYAQRYDNIVFRPKGDHKPNQFNLWNPPVFKREEDEDLISLFKELVWEIISDKCPIIHEYLWKWMARILQKPWDQNNRTALVLCSEAQGTGKSAFGELFGMLFGRHFLKITDGGTLLARFGMVQIEGKILVLNDESSWCESNENVGKLKNIITSDTLTLERKGMDIRSMDNYSNFIFTSNEDYPVAISPQDRRFVALKIPETRSQDEIHDFITEAKKQLLRGGLNQLYNKLMNIDIEHFHAQNKPKNQHTFDVKMAGATPIANFCYHILMEAEVMNIALNTDEGTYLDRKDLYNEYLTYCKIHHLKSDIERVFWGHFKKIMKSTLEWRTTTGRSSRHEYLSPLNISRENFANYFKTDYINWE